MIFTFFDSICYFFYHLLTLSFLFFIFFIFIYYITQKDSKNCSKENFPRVCQILISSIFKKDAVTDYESKTNLLYSNFGHRCSLVSTVLCVPSFGLHFIEALVFPRWRVTQVKLSFEGDSFLSFFWFPQLVEGGRRQSHCGILSISQKKDTVSLNVRIGIREIGECAQCVKGQSGIRFGVVFEIQTNGSWIYVIFMAD